MASSGKLASRLQSHNDDQHLQERSKAALDNSGGDLSVDSAYTPHTWQLTEKSDVWVLGLIAHKMMYAHITKRTEEESVEESTLSKEFNWGSHLGGRQIGASESHFQMSTTKIKHIPAECSARLCLLVEQCLRHDMEERPNLKNLSKLCQNELTRLDSVPGAAAGKRKRGEEDDSVDTEFRVLIGKNNWHARFDKYRPGEAYQAKRQRTRLDLGDDHPQRAAYTQLVTAWSNLARPTAEAQGDVIDGIDMYLLDPENGQPMTEDDSEEYQWAAKHLISSLRKRNNPQKGVYVLAGKYIDTHGDAGWMESAWQPPIKIQILKYLLDSEDFWDGFIEKQGRTDALAAIENAMRWGLMMLRDIRTPAETDIMGNDISSRPAEPRTPRMEDQSALHEGIYDWIFVKPTGAYLKN